MAHSRLTTRALSDVNLLSALGEGQSCKTNYWNKTIANGWTREWHPRPAELIRKWQPWEKWTGPRKAVGKSVVSQNAYKGGTWRMLRELSRALWEQNRRLVE